MRNKIIYTVMAILILIVGFTAGYFGKDIFDENISEEITTSQIVKNSYYLGNYTLSSKEFGTNVSVKLENGKRIINSNALPNHKIGTFPNEGNPNSVSEQSNTYSFTLNPAFVGSAVSAREPGVAVNGIKFDPETAEMVSCSTSETYRIEALQETYNLGFDENNAHVQPTGAYHYHGVPTSLVEILEESDEDLVHVGFASDGFMIYYSKSGKYKPSFQLSEEIRTGDNCTYRGKSISISGTKPNGIYVSDWKYVTGAGDLDKCNGININGEYAYFVTNEYPFVSRCLNGEYTESNSGRTPMGPPPAGMR